MVEVESFCLGLVSVVEGEKAVVPVEASYLIDVTADVDLGFTSHELVEVEAQV